MDAIQKKVREEHPDWTDEQVTAEVARITAEQEDQPKPDPDPKPDNDAMARLRRERDQATKDAKTAKDALAAKERAEAEQAGQWEQLAKQYEGERDEARQELADLRQQIRVEGIATSLKFRHADEALALLKTTAPDLDRNDDQAVKAALEALATNRQHLIDNGAPGPSGRPAGGQPPEGTLTIEQIKQMSPEEVARRMDEVDAVLAAQQ